MADALRQRGVAFDQVDANDGVGGNWRQGIYKGVHIVSSKRSTAFADYPMPSHYPDFPSALADAPLPGKLRARPRHSSTASSFARRW